MLFRSGNIGSSQLLAYSTIFTRNRTFDKGGAIGNYDNATVRLSNCTVYHNQSSINNEGGALTIDNTIFYDNYLGSNFEDALKTGLSTDITPNGHPLSITNSMLQHNHVCTGCISTNNQSPQFRNATDPPPSGGLAGADNIWLTADDNLQLSCGGSALNTGNNSKVIGTQDALGNPRIQLTTVDLGAYESALNPPIITSQLTNQTLCAGSTLTLSVTATGAGTIQYQWQSNRGVGFEDILGATAATYVLPNILEMWNGVQVRCMVSNGFCGKPSDVSILTVNGAPTIVRQPAQLVICPLDTAIFSVSSKAFGAQTYQWQVNSGAGFVNVTGQTDSILTLFNAPPSLSGNQYRCVITSQCLSKPSESARLYFLHTAELYVDSTATGIADGSSWANAFPTLQLAIELTKCGTVTKINVAKGTYTPSKTSPTYSIDPANPDNPQQYAFYLTNNTVLLGGYPSGGGTVRNAKINRTVLSGNVGAFDNQNDNTFNLLMTQGLDSTTVIDGFVFTETGYDVGAIHNDTSSPTIRNCVFLNNGRGIYNTASSPSVSDCYFEGQIQTIVNTDSSKVRIERCVFAKNRQVIVNYNSNTAVNASVFDGNDSGSFSGAAVDNKGSSTAILSNCLKKHNC